MRKSGIILSAALLILCAAGCNKESQFGTGLPDIRFGIRISDPDGSKALLESDDLLTAGSQIQVYGFRSDGTDIVGHTETAGTSKLNEGKTIQYAAGTGWSFINNNNEQYQWKNATDHTFYGWLTNDAKSSLTAAGFFGGGFGYNTASKILTIPAKTMGINAANFDFAYSDIVNRSASSADYSTVNLSLNHLFSSFSLSARNYSTKQVTIKSIKLHGLKDSKGATIDYSGSAADVIYGTGSVAAPLTLYSGALNLAAAGSTGDSKANVVGTPSDSRVSILVWPQTSTEMTYTGATDTDGNIAPAAGDSNQPYLEITYNQGDGDISAYAAIPHDADTWGWGPGIRHEMELSFQDREIDLGFKAAKWDKMEPVIDYNGAVTVTTKLRLAAEFYNNCTLSSTGDTAFFKPGTPIILEFAIGSPENATWLVGERMDWDAFDVYNYPDGARTSEDQVITAEGVVDGTLTRIAIDPPTRNLQKNEFALELSFTVRMNNGEMVSIEDDDIFDEGCPRKFIYIKF